MVNDIDLKALFTEDGKIKNVEERFLRNDVYKELEKTDFISDIQHKEIITLINKIRSSDYDECNKNKNKFLLDLISNKMNKDDVYRYVYELVQNSDDCAYGDVQPTIKFDVNKGKDVVTVSYNERGFRVKDIIAITDFGGSTKNKIKSISDQEQMKTIDESQDLQLIGEKGIGFKTIFRMVEEVEIHSKGYHFRLTSEKPTLPEWIEDCEETEGTVLKLKFKTKDNSDDKKYSVEFFEALKDRFHSKNEKLFTENPILFTRQIKHITVSDTDGKSFVIAIKKKENSNIIEIYDEDPNKNEGIAPKIETFKYSQEITISEDAYQSRYNEKQEDESRRKYNITIMACMGQGINKGKLYSFLPTGIEFDAPIVIDAPFKLTTDRAGVEITEAEKWNEELLKAIFLDDNCLLEEFYKQFATEIKDNEELNILKYIIPFSDTNLKTITMNDNQNVGLYYGLLTKDQKNEVCDKIKELPIVKMHEKDELSKISETVFLKDEIGYKFPIPKKIIEKYNAEKGNQKILGDARYVEDYHEKIECFLKKIDWRETIEKAVNGMVVNENLLEFLEAYYEEIEKKANFENFNIFPALMNDNTESRYLNCCNPTIWIEPIEGKSTFLNDDLNYAILNNEILSESKFPKLFAFHSDKIKREWIQEIVDVIKGGSLGEELSNKLRVLYYFTFNEGKQIEKWKWDCRENNRPSKSFETYCFEDNLFTKNEICKKINETPDLNIGFNNCIEFYKKIGCRQSNDFFIFATDFIKLDDATNNLIQKCEDIKAAKSIKEAYEKIEEDKKPLKIQFDPKIPLEVKKYIMTSEILSGDPVKEFCEACFYDELGKTEYNQELLICALSKLPTEWKPQYKDVEIKIDLNIAINFYEDVSEIMKRHNLINFEINIGDSRDKYRSRAIESAISYLDKGKEKTYEDVCKDYLGIEDGFYTADLSEKIGFIYDSKKALLSSNNTENHLVSFVDEKMKNKRKDEYKGFKKDLEWFSMKETVKEYFSNEPKNEKTKENYIKDLSELRKNQSEAIEDLKIMELINESKPNAKDYILREIFQNINDCKHTNENGRCVNILLERKEDKEQLIFEYHEDGFNSKDIYGITSLGESTKHDEEEGEKGIGFKTVFEIFDRVRIYSNGYKFKIEKNKPLIPIWLDDGVDVIEKKTKMIFEIDNKNDENSLEAIKTELDKAFETYELFLFLENINRYEYKNKTVEKSNFVDKYYYAKEKLYDENHINDSAIVEVFKKRKKLEKRSDEQVRDYLSKLYIGVYIPKEINESNKNGSVYSTLPTNLQFGAPVYINMPLELTTGRNDTFENEYNKILIEYIFKNEGEKCIFNKIFNKLAQDITMSADKCMLTYLPKPNSKFKEIDLNENLRHIKFLKSNECEELISIVQGYSVPKPFYEFIERFEDGLENVKEYMEMPGHYIVKNTKFMDEINCFAKELDDSFYPKKSKILEYLAEINFFDKDVIVNLEDEKIKYLKDILIPYISENDEFWDKDLSIYPYKCSEVETRLSNLNGDWYYIGTEEYKNFYSNSKYKIFNDKIFGDDFTHKLNAKFNKYCINEFNSRVIIDSYLEDMSKENDYNQEWWDAAKGLYKIWSGETDGFKEATANIGEDNNKMYFKKGYLLKEEKGLLLSLNIVDDLMEGIEFEQDEGKDFKEFLNLLGVKSEFSWVEGKKEQLNGWSEDFLIDHLVPCFVYEGKDEYNNLAQLFDKLILETVSDKLRENLDFSDNYYINFPNLCKDKEYRPITGRNPLMWVEDSNIISKDEYNDKFGRFICEDGKYNTDYFKMLGILELNEIEPNKFKVSEENLLSEDFLEFWKWVYKNSKNPNLPEKLIDYLLKNKSQLDDSIIEASQRFLLDIITEKNTEKDESVELLGSVIADYLETVNKCSLKFSCSDPKKIEIKEIVEEIQSEIKFRDNYIANADEINRFMENIIAVGEKRQEIGFAQLASTLALPHQTDNRRYRECISSFLKNQYNISLDKRECTITAIDNTCAKKVSEITEEEFNTLEIENLGWVNINDKEIKKRLLMEPYLYKSKYIQGYGRTCPLCGKAVITEITTMRIKTIVEENKRYDFLCCSSCADLFNYCDNQPKIDFEDLGKINAKIKLEFFIEPHFLSEPYKVEFKPRPLHRKILLLEKCK